MIKSALKAFYISLFVVGGFTLLFIGYANGGGAVQQGHKFIKRTNGFWYVTMESGANWRKNAPLGNGDKSFLAGPVAGATFGYQFNKLFRAEGEIIFRETALGAITDTQPGPLTAEEGSFSFMANGYFTPVTIHHFAPFVGVGVGYGLAIYSIHINLLPPPSFKHVRFGSGNFAYQFLVGINYTIFHGLRFGIEYKYFAIPTIYYKNLRSNYKTHEILFQLSYLFNQQHQRDKFGAKVSNNVNVSHRFYIAGAGGLSIRDQQPFGTGTKAFHLGPFAGFAFGYNLSKYIRAEAELSMRQNEVKNVLLGQAGTSNRPSSDETILVYMTNVFISPCTFHGFTLYIGGGVGYAYDSYAIHDNLPPNIIRVPPTLPPFKHPRISDSGFAYQVMGGISHPLTQRILMSIGYRYFRITHIHYVSFDGAPPIASHVSAHTVLLRLTFLLGK